MSAGYLYEKNVENIQKNLRSLKCEFFDYKKEIFVFIIIRNEVIFQMKPTILIPFPRSYEILLLGNETIKIDDGKIMMTIQKITINLN